MFLGVGRKVMKGGLPDSDWVRIFLTHLLTPVLYELYMLYVESIRFRELKS